MSKASNELAGASAAATVKEKTAKEDEAIAAEDPEGTAFAGAPHIPTEDGILEHDAQSEVEAQAEEEGDGAPSPAGAPKRQIEDKHANSTGKGRSVASHLGDPNEEPQKGVKQVSLSSLLAGHTADSENGPSAALKVFLTADGLTEAVADKLFEVVGMTTIDDFGYKFETRSEVHTRFWKFVPEWERHGSISSKLKKAWERAADVNQRNRDIKVTALDDNLDAPIPKEDNNSLTKEWMRTYNFRIPPTLEGNAALQRKRWRILTTRNFQAMEITGTHAGNIRLVVTS